MEANKFIEQLEHKIQGLEQDKERLEKTLEESKIGTLILESLKVEATTVNEELKSEQKKCFCILNDIQRNIDDQTRLEDQMEEIRDKYQKAQDAFDRIVDW
jgi:hypothetical protein